MSDLVTGVRIARPSDAAGISRVFDAAWREAYRGVIPGVQLERMVQRRGPLWWRRNLGRGRPVAVIDVGKQVVGYACYGRARGAGTTARGEVDELYLLPEYQGIGLGRRLFRAVLNDLRHRYGGPVVVWSLGDNERACRFYEGCGGREAARIVERMGDAGLTKVAYLFG